MAKNQRLSDANHIHIPVPEGTKSGDPVRVGRICGVAQTDRTPEGGATVWLDKSWDVQVTGPVTQVGSPLYLANDGSKVLSATSGASNSLWGTALTIKGGAAGDVGTVEAVAVGYAQS